MTGNLIVDRLTTLMQRFHLAVRTVELSDANLLALSGPDGSPSHLVFFTAEDAQIGPTEGVILSAKVEWSGQNLSLIHI